MPLLDRKEHPPGAKVAPKNADEVFVIRCTGEVVRTYEEYIHKRNLYALHKWQDKYYGRTGLTYEEALRFEEQAENQIKEQFPKELEENVVRAIHHSRLKKDELINKMHSTLKPAGIQPTESDKENGTPASSTPGAPPVTKRLLTHFLIYVADKLKPGIWVCKEQWVQKYGLPTELPEGLQLASTEPSSPAPGGSKSAAIAAAAAGDSTPMKTPLKSRSAADGPPAPVRSLEEEEARLKPGSLKAAAFQVMKARGTQPTTVEDIIRITTIDGTRTDWPDKAKKQLGHVLGADSAFTRLARGQYVLAALAKDLPLPSPLVESQPSAGVSGGQASKAAASGGGKVPDGKDASEGPEQSGLVRAEQLLSQAQKAVAARQAEVAAADEQLEVCEKRLNEAKEAKAQSKASSKSSPMKSSQGAAGGDGLPSSEELDRMFALPEHLLEYTGSEDDRKAKSAWRHEKAKKEKELAAERAKYLQEARLKAAKEAQASMSGLQQAYDRAKKSAEEASAKLGKALKVEAEAKRAVEREKQREMLKGIKEKAKEDKEKQKQVEKEEREKRRQEALAARRYPIDDLELLTQELTAAVTAVSAGAAGSSAAAAATLPAEQLDLVCLSEADHLAPEESLELGQLLYVADTLGQFSKQLGVKGCTHAELRAMLAAAAAAGTGLASGEESSKQQAREALQWFGATYTQLLKVLVEDVTALDNCARVFHRWAEVLECGPGAWPELARRWVLLQEQDQLASPEALDVAEFLRTHEASILKPQQHLALLTQLLDDCMDTSRIRDALTNRIEKGAELAAEIRAELVEGRKKLRELADAEKESRKRKRAAALALATAAAERQLREKGELPADGEVAAAAEAAAADAADTEEAKQGEAGVSGGAKDTVSRKIQATTKEILSRVAGPGATNVTLAELEAELGADFEEEPSWELPPELQAYSGPEGDKKLMSEFRRKQQEARKKLDKERAKWQAGKAERAKARAEAKKKEIEAERRLQAERKRAEQELAEQQETLELKLEKYLVRRQPVGSDRFNRMYWWGLAGNKEGLLLQQETGCAETTLELLREAAAEAAAAQAAEDKQQGQDEAAAMDVDQQQEDTAGPSDRKQHGGLESQSPESCRNNQGTGGKGSPRLSWPLDHKGLLLPAGPEGWAVINDAQLLEGLLNGLEQRGVREKELKQTLDKMLPAVSSAIAKAAAAKAAAEAAAAAAQGSSKKEKVKKEKESVVPRELPSRHARSAAAEQIRKTGTAAPKAKEDVAAPAVAFDEDEGSGVLHGWQLAAVKSAVNNIQELSVPAAIAKAAYPDSSSSWVQYREQLEGLAQGEVPASWSEEVAASAAALATSGILAAAAAGPSTSTAKDALWTKAIQAAAVAAAAVDAAAEDDKQQAQAAACVAQLRLQLLSFEEQLVAATGEVAYLCRGAAAADEDDQQDMESEGEAEGSEQQQQQSKGGHKGKQGHSSKGTKAESSKGQGSEQQEEAAMEVDQGEQQQATTSKGRGGKAKAAAASSEGRRGVKRGASAALSDDHAAAGDAVNSKAEGDDDKASKRKKTAAASGPGLPPRPASHVGRGRGAAAAAAATDDGERGETSPPSREGSVAPANSTDVAAAAPASLKKRGRPAKASSAAAAAAAAGSRATSQEPEQQEDEHQQHGKKQKGAKRGRGSRAAAEAAEDEEAAEGATGDAVVSEDADVDDGNAAGKRRHSLPYYKHQTSDAQSADPDEVVAEDGDEVIPIRLRGRAIWMHGEERDSWRASVAAASTAAALSFCAAALVFHAEQPLEALAAAKAAGGKKKASKKK